MTILIVDDEPALRRMIRIAFEASGHTVVQADGVRTGLAESVMARPDCILLDLGLPDGSGASVLEELRAWSDVPIIVLTATDSEELRVRLLRGGADDFVSKPFSMPELLARVEAVTRRRTIGREHTVLHCGTLRMDVIGHKVFHREAPIHVTSTEFAILRTFMMHVGKAVSYAMISSAVWGPQARTDPHTLRVHIAQIRKKFSGLPMLTTLVGYGYRLDPGEEEGKG